MLRSFLFVPGDSERKQAKAMASAADALIFDLEDSVAPDRLPFAREQVANVLAARPSGTAQQFWVRTNSLSSGALLQDVRAVLGAAPAGLVLPKVSQPSEAQLAHHYLCALEVQHGLVLNSTKLIVVATETACCSHAWRLSNRARADGGADLGRGGSLGGARRVE